MSRPAGRLRRYCGSNSGRVGGWWKSHGSSGVGSGGFQILRVGSGHPDTIQLVWYGMVLYTEKGSDPRKALVNFGWISWVLITVTLHSFVRGGVTRGVGSKLFTFRDSGRRCTRNSVGKRPSPANVMTNPPPGSKQKQQAESTGWEVKDVKK